MNAIHSVHKALPKKRSLAISVYLWLLAGTALLVVTHLTFQYLNLNVYNELNGPIYELSNRVDFDDEISIPTWVSQFLLLGIGGAAFFAALVQRNINAKRAWGAIGIVGVLLSIDEVASLHEFALQVIHVSKFNEALPTVSSNAWIALLPFVMIGGLLLLWFVAKHIPRKTLLLMMTGSALLLIGAVAIDIISSADNVNTFYVKGILVAVEETLEIIGSSTILYAILDYLETHHGAKIRAARSKLRS